MPIRFKQNRAQATEEVLQRASVTGATGAVAGQFIILLVTLASTVVLARLLTPADFGLMAIVTAIAAFILCLQDLGLEAASVQTARITTAQVTTLFWLGLLVALVTTIAAALAAFPLSWLTGNDALLSIMLVYSVTFLFNGIAAQPRAILRRRMQFKRLITVQVIAAALGSVAGVLAAALGASYWSLVVMSLVRSAALASGVWITSGWRPGLPTRQGNVRPLIRFGSFFTGSRILNTTVRNADDLFIGGVLGTVALGFYCKAYQLLLLPIIQITTPVSTVVVPALSRLQRRPQRYRRHYRRWLEILSALTIPIVCLGFISADEIVLLFLGDQWEPAIPLFRALAPAGLVGAVNVATGWVYMSLGTTDRQFRWQLLSASITVVGIVIGLNWGAMGVALCISITMCALRLPGILYCFRGTFLSLGDVAAPLWRPGLAAVFATLVTGVYSCLPPPRTLLLGLELCLNVCVFAAVYLLAWCALPGGRARIARAWNAVGVFPLATRLTSIMVGWSHAFRSPTASRALKCPQDSASLSSEA